MNNPQAACISTTNIGVISDTHGLLRPEAIEHLRGSDLIIHAGDIGSIEVISELKKIAPLKAIRGNIDKGAWADHFADLEVVEVHGKYLYVLHNLNDLDLDPVAAGFDVVICGHSHAAKIETVDGVLYLNPGSAGPRRFKLPVTLATVSITLSGVSAQVHELPIENTPSARARRAKQG
ncbi:MAG: putative phosphoesterase [Gammaproteobacteria bacterium]|jgi:putative phosphoesterase